MTAHQEAGTATPERFMLFSGAMVSTHEGDPPFLPAGDWVRSADYDALRADLTAAREALEATKLESFRAGARSVFDSLLYRAANNYHANPAINDECNKENALIKEWAETALEDASPEDCTTWRSITKLVHERDEERRRAATAEAALNVAEEERITTQGYILEVLQPRIDAAEAALAGVREDAERYRWLKRERSVMADEPFIARRWPDGISRWTEADADRVIDAARLPPASDGKGA